MIKNYVYFDGLEQERRKSSALAMELRLNCTNPSIWSLSESYTGDWVNLNCAKYNLITW